MEHKNNLLMVSSPSSLEMLVGEEEKKKKEESLERFWSSRLSSFCTLMTYLYFLPSQRKSQLRLSGSNSFRH